MPKLDWTAPDEVPAKPAAKPAKKAAKSNGTHTIALERENAELKAWIAGIGGELRALVPLQGV